MKASDEKFSSHQFRKSSRRKFALVAPALLALFLSAGVGIAVRAQDGDALPGEPPEAQRESEARRRGANLAALLRVLNLSPQQRAQIGAIRRETEPQGRLLGARLRQARRALDEAIYASPAPDESIIEERVREVGAAQAAVLRLRSLTELRIRRVLMPEQLEAFRRLQRQALTRRRRMNQLTPRPAGTPGDAPAPRFRDRMQRRRQERQQQRQLDEQNAPSSPPATRERRPAHPSARPANP